MLLLAAAGGVAWYLQSRHEEAPEYQTANVARGDLTQVVTATGQLGPVVNVEVGSQISGIIRKIYVDYNSLVKSNQLIAEIDPSTYQVNVLKAEADLANAKANRALAKVQADRSESLHAAKLVSDSDNDTAKAQLQQADAQVQSTEATLKNAQVQLSYCTIYAPVDGVVISRNVDVGQTVAASFNTPTLFIIANDLTKMQIEALVSEADIGGVAVGQNVNFTVDAFPYRTFNGKLSQIRYGAVTNQNVVTYDCIVDVNNSDSKLLPGMTANVSIIVAQKENALKVPNAALRFHPPDVTNAPAQLASAQMGGPGEGRPGGPGGGGGGGMRRGDRGQGPGGGPGGGMRPRQERQLMRTVYVLPANADAKNPNSLKPQPVKIRVGISDGISTEVLDGLDEGAQVVTGIISGGDSMAAARPSSPFGGGFRRF